jgi:hypothetical protein
MVGVPRQAAIVLQFRGRAHAAIRGANGRNQTGRTKLVETEQLLSSRNYIRAYIAAQDI